MSVETDNLNIGNIPRKRSYPLKMETLPTSENQKDSQNIVTSTQTQITTNSETPDIDVPHTVERPTSSFETDHDFRFKRHKNNRIAGVPSLGERLDNLQDVKKAKWIDNFDSSMPQAQTQETRGKDTDDEEEAEEEVKSTNNLPSSQPNINFGEAPYLAPNQWQQQPMYYRYMPMPGSPVYASQVPVGTSIPQQYMNQSIQMMPNSSLQPFYPSQIMPNSQLLPPPTLNHNNLQYAQRTRNSRKSMAEQRGRRLSIISNRDQMIISPHRDIPEDQFYRHIGNTSFAENMQLRQLFSWCSIRSLDKMRHDARDEEKFNDGLPQSFVKSKNIAVSIIKDFVNELRRDRLDIDWDAEDDPIPPAKMHIHNENENQEEIEDTVLRNLFGDDDDDTAENDVSADETFYYTGLGVKKVAKGKKWNSNIGKVDNPKARDKRKTQLDTLLPNSKNVKNEQHLMILEEKVKKLRSEIAEWVSILDNQKPGTEWEENMQFQKTEITKIQAEINEQNTSDNLLSLSQLEDDLSDRISRLQVHTHLIKSHSIALSKTTTNKLETLSREFLYKEQQKQDPLASKLLLRGLSEALSNK